MKHNEIEQAVIELCDVVPSVFKWNGAISDCPMLEFVGTEEGVWGVGITRYLAVIAQHAKLYAAQQDWMPYTDFHDGTYSLCLVDSVMEYPRMGRQTKWLEFDPTQLGSEELQWIRAVTEVAKLITNQGAMK